MVRGYNCYGWVKDESEKWRNCNQHEESTTGYCRNCGEYKTSIKGRVVYQNNSFITVQGKNYRECFLHGDFKCNDYKIHVLDRKEVAV